MHPAPLEIWLGDAGGGRLVGYLFANPSRGGVGLLDVVKHWDTMGVLTRQDARDYATAFENEELEAAEEILGARTSVSAPGRKTNPTADRGRARKKR